MKYISESDAEKLYEYMLDDCYGTVAIAGLEYSTSCALKEIDPTAYRCGFADWLDGEGLTTEESESDEESDDEENDDEESDD